MVPDLVLDATDGKETALRIVRGQRVAYINQRSVSERSRSYSPPSSRRADIISGSRLADRAENKPCRFTIGPAFLLAFFTTSIMNGFRKSRGPSIKVSAVPITMPSPSKL